jgi:hypothetical protein
VAITKAMKESKARTITNSRYGRYSALGIANEYTNSISSTIGINTLHIKIMLIFQTWNENR